MNGIHTEVSHIETISEEMILVLGKLIRTAMDKDNMDYESAIRCFVPYISMHMKLGVTYEDICRAWPRVETIYRDIMRDWGIKCECMSMNPIADDIIPVHKHVTNNAASTLESKILKTQENGTYMISYRDNEGNLLNDIEYER